MAAPISASAAARYLCERSDWMLTNLELQKILYLSQMVYMGQHEGDRLMNATFEAWDYGPVIPSVYNQVRSFGAGPIKDVFYNASPIMDEERRNLLDDAYDHLSKVTAGQLVSITHWKYGAWAKTYVPGSRGVVIPDDAIYAEARERDRRREEREQL